MYVCDIVCQHNIPETTTIGEICKMVIMTNNDWFVNG